MNGLIQKHVILFLFVVGSLTAQDNKLWNFNVGYSYFNNMNNDIIGKSYNSYNKLAVPNSFGIEKYFYNRMGLKFNTTFNNFESVTLTNEIENIKFLALDLGVKYNLTNGLGNKLVFDPFVMSGLGFSGFDSYFDPKYFLGAGVGVWLNNKWSVQLNTVYNDNFNLKNSSYLTHSLGLSYDLQGKKEINKYYAEKKSYVPENEIKSNETIGKKNHQTLISYINRNKTVNKEENQQIEIAQTNTKDNSTLLGAIRGNRAEKNSVKNSENSKKIKDNSTLIGSLQKNKSNTENSTIAKDNSEKPKSNSTLFGASKNKKDVSQKDEETKIAVVEKKVAKTETPKIEAQPEKKAIAEPVKPKIEEQPKAVQTQDKEGSILSKIEKDRQDNQANQPVAVVEKKVVKTETPKIETQPDKKAVAEPVKPKIEEQPKAVQTQAKEGSILSKIEKDRQDNQANQPIAVVEKKVVKTETPKIETQPDKKAVAEPVKPKTEEQPKAVQTQAKEGSILSKIEKDRQDNQANQPVAVVEKKVVKTETPKIETQFEKKAIAEPVKPKTEEQPKTVQTQAKEGSILSKIEKDRQDNQANQPVAIVEKKVVKTETPKIETQPEKKAIAEPVKPKTEEQLKAVQTQAKEGSILSKIEKDRQDNQAKPSMEIKTSQVISQSEAKTNEYLDSDKDGVLDSDDKCPTVYGDKDNYGCPKKIADNKVVVNESASIQEIEEKHNFVLPENIYVIKFTSVNFDLDASSLEDDAKTKINQIINLSQNYPEAYILVDAISLDSGDVSYNNKISNKRIAAIKSYLKEKGIPDQKINSRIISPNSGETNTKSRVKLVLYK